jgi:hypothetical protein
MDKLFCDLKFRERQCITIANDEVDKISVLEKQASQRSYYELSDNKSGSGKTVIEARMKINILLKSITAITLR